MFYCVLYKTYRRRPHKTRLILIHHWHIIDHYTLDLIYDFDKDTWRAANRGSTPGSFPQLFGHTLKIWSTFYGWCSLCRSQAGRWTLHYCVHFTSLGAPLSLLQMSERSSFPSLSLCLLFLLGVLMTHWAGWIETWWSSLTPSIFQPLQSPFPQNM